MKRSLIILGVLTLCGSFAFPAAAAEKGWHLRVFAAGFDPDLDVMVPAENPDMIRVTADSDLGWGASLEYQFSKRLGLELGYMQASPEIALSAEDVSGYGDILLKDSMSTRAITLDLYFHLTPKSQFFDFYLGAGIASMGYGDRARQGQQLGGGRRASLHLDRPRGHPGKHRDLRLQHLFVLGRDCV